MKPERLMRAPDIAYLTDVYFGRGKVDVVPELLARFGVARPLGCSARRRSR